MPRVRDYKAEYRRRRERGDLLGLSTAQSRGHPRKGETSLTELKRQSKSDKALDRAILRMHHGEGLKAAARAARVSDKRLRRYLALHNMATRKGRTWRLNDKRMRPVPVISDKKFKVIIVPGYAPAREAGIAWDIQTGFRNLPDKDRLATLEGRGVTDVYGQFHPFETDPSTLYSLFNIEAEAFHEIYRIMDQTEIAS